MPRKRKSHEHLYVKLYHGGIIPLSTYKWLKRKEARITGCIVIFFFLSVILGVILTQCS